MSSIFVTREGTWGPGRWIGIIVLLNRVYGSQTDTGGGLGL